jgi:hypothetical protein
MRRALFLSVAGLLLGVPAHAGDYTVAYRFPTADQAGLVSIPGAGFAACGGGSACRSAGALGLHAVAGVGIPARSTADILFSRPAGTAIVGGSVTIRYRVRDAGVHARLIWSNGGAYRAKVLPDRAAWAVAAIRIPAGATRVGPSLYASTAVRPAAVTSGHDDEVTVQRIDVVLRDTAPPRVAITGGALGDGAWHAGTVCGQVLARDAGLGVYGISLAVGEVEAALTGAAGTRLQPRPRELSGELCIDTTGAPDGYLQAVLEATDGVTAGGNRSRPVLVPLQVDNTPPLLVAPAPTGNAAADDQIVVRAIDAGSGVAPDSVVVSLDGSAVAGVDGPDDEGWLRATPPEPLAPGLHHVTVTAADVAGNATESGWSFAVAEPLSVSFGHARLALRPGPVRIPVVLRYGNEPAAGVAVEIRLGGVVLGAAVSDGRGVARVTAAVWKPGRLVGSAGTATAVARVVLRPGVALAGPPGDVRAGRAARLRGVVVPWRAPVAIEAYSRGAWHVVRRLRAPVGGRFSTTVSLPRHGLYVFRAVAGRHRSRLVEIWAG